MNKFIIGTASLGVGSFYLIPAAIEASTLLIGEEKHKQFMKNNFVGLSEEQKQLQQHVNDHCNHLQIRPIIIIPMEHVSEFTELFNAPVLGPTIVTSNECNDSSLIKGMVNRELGHYFYKHYLQQAAVKGVIGALFFFKKTRKLGCASLVAFKALENSWNRFQEKEADAHSIQYSTAKELNSLVKKLSEDPSFLPKPQNPTAMDKVVYTLFATHPYTEDRIALMEKAIKEKSA